MPYRRCGPCSRLGKKTLFSLKEKSYVFLGLLNSIYNQLKGENSREKALNSREKALDSREKELDSREKALDFREKELEHREIMCENKEKELEIREEICREREKELGINLSVVPENGVLDLIIIRCHKDGTRAMAKPCAKCLPCIQSAGVRYIYYTDWEGKLVRELASEMITTHVCSKSLCEEI